MQSKSIIFNIDGNESINDILLVLIIASATFAIAMFFILNLT